MGILKSCWWIYLLALWSIPAQVKAIHFIGGEIRYTPSGDDPLTYHIEVDVYTKLSAWDYSEITMDYGDGSTGIMPRTAIVDYTERDIRLSTYHAEHTYATPGTYTVSSVSYNRSGGILNIPNSIGQSACIYARIVIDLELGQNHSIAFDTLQFQIRRNGSILVHEPAPFDVDGDSLVFELVPVLGHDCTPVPGYMYPIASNTFEVNPQNGELLWDAPVLFGEYNVNIRGSEYRNGQLIGQVTRDMTIVVAAIPLGFGEVFDEEPFALFPTVTDDLVTVLNRTHGTLSLDVIAANGALVRVFRVDAQQSSISFGDLASGLYTVQARTIEGAVLHHTRLIRH